MNKNSPFWPVNDAASRQVYASPPTLAVVRIYSSVNYFEDRRLELEWRGSKALTVAQLYDNALGGYWIEDAFMPREHLRFITVGKPFTKD